MSGRKYFITSGVHIFCRTEHNRIVVLSTLDDICLKISRSNGNFKANCKLYHTVSCAVSYPRAFKRKGILQITSRLIEAATNIFLELKIFFISASHSLK